MPRDQSNAPSCPREGGPHSNTQTASQMQLRAKATGNEQVQTDNLDFIKIDTVYPRMLSAEWKGDPQAGRKYLQIMYLTRN